MCEIRSTASEVQFWFLIFNKVTFHFRTIFSKKTVRLGVLAGGSKKKKIIIIIIKTLLVFLNVQL